MFNVHVVLFQPEIPQNTGAIGRLCVNLDVPLHLIKPLGFSLDESKVKRAGLDYWPYLQLKTHENWEEFLAYKSNAPLLFISTKGKRSIFEWEYQPGTFFIFGRETSGLPLSFYTQYEPLLYRIPMPGIHARSLNLANAVAVVLYEAYRQYGVRNRLFPITSTDDPSSHETWTDGSLDNLINQKGKGAHGKDPNSNCGR